MWGGGLGLPPLFCVSAGADFVVFGAAVVVQGAGAEGGEAVDPGVVGGVGSGGRGGGGSRRFRGREGGGGAVVASGGRAADRKRAWARVGARMRTAEPGGFVRSFVRFGGGGWGGPDGGAFGGFSVPFGGLSGFHWGWWRRRWPLSGGVWPFCYRVGR